MSAPLTDPIDAAFVAGAITALRKRAAIQRQIANEGTVAAGDKFPGVAIKSPEAAHASTLAADWDEVADDLKREVES